jgi:hypothetical protein
MIELLLLAAFVYATRDSLAGLFKSYAADKRKGQNELAWWGSEIRHGFPNARHPFMSTWRAHQAATGQMKEERLKARPGEIASQKNLRATLAEHRKRIAAARTAPADTPRPQTGGRRHSQPAANGSSQTAADPTTFRQPLDLVDDPPDGQAPAGNGWPGGAQPPETEPCQHCGRKTFHMIGCPAAQPPGSQPAAGAPPAGATATGCPRCGCPR